MSKGPSLKDKLEALRVRNAEWKQRYDGLVANLVAAGVGDAALKAGDAMPDFMLSNADGELVAASTLLAHGPMVLSFYRGRWCPYCVTELEALREATQDIQALGANLVAVTAEDCGGALVAKRRHRLEFEILCDPENGLGLAFGLLFRMPEDILAEYRKIDVDFPVLYGNRSGFLPIPATYVIGQDGTIRHAYVNPDFRERLEPTEILAILKMLQAPVTVGPG